MEKLPLEFLYFRSANPVIKIFLKSFWSLPYNVRRSVYRSFSPSYYKELQELRYRENASQDAVSLWPFDAYHCIFVHIPKTAGVSLSNSLFGNLGGSHTSIMKYQLIFTKQEFESYFKFTVVRNPWDRLVSAYHFLKKGGLNAKDRIWADEHLVKYSCFSDFVKHWVCPQNIYSFIHFYPQHVFISDPYGIKVDFIARFERLAEDFEIVQKRIHIPALLQRRNASPDRDDYSSYYDDEAREIVARTYHKDISLFGYRFQ